MRSAGGTNPGPPFVVTLSTNATIARLAAPSFQDGSGSVPAGSAARTTVASNTVARTVRRFTTSSDMPRTSIQVFEPLGPHLLARLERIVPVEIEIVVPGVPLGAQRAIEVVA